MKCNDIEIINFILQNKMEDTEEQNIADMPYKKCSKQDLLTLFMENIERFKTVMALAFDAISTISNESSRLDPDPRQKIQEIYDVICSNEDLFLFREKMMSSSGSGKTFIDRLISKVTKNRFTDRDLIEYIKEKIPDNYRMFLRLLYFFSFCCKTNINKILEINGISAWSVDNCFERLVEFSGIDTDEVLLWHGTSPSCVYSILSNSLRNLSGTKLMTSGQAFGSGIYLSDSVDFSLGYCGRGFLSRSQTYISNFNYIFIVRTKNINKKTRNIYVQQEQDILICGFLKIPKNVNSLSDEDCTQFLRVVEKKTRFKAPKKLKTEVVEQDVPRGELPIFTTRNVTDPFTDERVVSSKRFTFELKKLQSDKPDFLIRFWNLEEGNPRSPLLFLCKPSDDSKLKKQCKKLGIPGMVFCVSMDANEEDIVYPFIPPKLRLVYPILERSTGRIATGGYICMSSLFSGDWSASNTLRGLLLSAISIICFESQEVNNSSKVRNEIPGGEVDETKIGGIYFYEDSLQGRTNISINHKWK